MKIGLKLTLTFFGIAFIAMLVAGIISYTSAKTTLKKESFNKLTAVREMKAVQITSYFNQIKNQLVSFSEDPSIIEATKQFKKGFQQVTTELNFNDKNFAQRHNKMDTYIDSVFIPELNKNSIGVVNKKNLEPKNPNALLLQQLFIAENPNKLGEKHLLDSIKVNCSYNKTHKKFHPVIRSFLERFGYYDVFLIDNETGDVLYTVYKEIDFASSLQTGAYRNTNLAASFNNALKIKNHDDVALVDYAEYLPSYNSPASFIACPIFDKGVVIGVLAFQMPIDNINSIMTNNKDWEGVGLGKTGESYIVGEDFTLRNQSRFLIEDSANYFKLLEEIGVGKLTVTKIRNYHTSVGLQEVKTQGTKEALLGKSNTLIFDDYRGVSVLSAFKPLNVLGMKWVIMSEIDEEEAFSPTLRLRNNILKGSLFVLFAILIISFFVSKQVTKPIKELEFDALELSKGNLDVKITNSRNDEIGSLANSFIKMQASLNDLIHGLEDKINERTKEVVKQKDIIQHKQKEIIDSMNYAKRIQHTLLASDKFLNKYVPNHFVLFKPKDIVSGDFYWATKNETHFYFAICDSTGHGVPGAFMSLLNMAFLNEAINQKKITEPHEILNHVRERLIKNLSKDGGKDGMDGILLKMDLATKKITYAAANNAPVIIRNGEIIELHADKMPIGIGIRQEPFKLYEADIQPGDTLISYTDGFADQFGGPKGKKLMYKPLKEQLKVYNSLSLNEQKEKLDTYFENWRGEQEQVDDVCIVGIKF
ncbi:MAG: SpoIIE family protein phosphatase [Bacteroidota bacterium]|nr:SpoIIE family protein phosphatase [Bacteroidota bacterium]